MYYEVKIKYPEVNEFGEVKDVNRSFLIDAMSFTEAETRMVELARERDFKDLTIKAITYSRINKVINEVQGDDDKFFNVTVTYIEETDEGKKKNYHLYYLVRAGVPEETILFIEQDWAGSTIEWKITQIKESPIVEVVNHE
mgnify:FL=1